MDALPRASSEDGQGGFNEGIPFIPWAHLPNPTQDVATSEPPTLSSQKSQESSAATQEQALPAAPMQDCAGTEARDAQPLPPPAIPTSALPTPPEDSAPPKEDASTRTCDAPQQALPPIPCDALQAALLPIPMNTQQGNVLPEPALSKPAAEPAKPKGDALPKEDASTQACDAPQQALAALVPIPMNTQQGNVLPEPALSKPAAEPAKPKADAPPKEDASTQACDAPQQALPPIPVHTNQLVPPLAKPAHTLQQAMPPAAPKASAPRGSASPKTPAPIVGDHSAPSRAAQDRRIRRLLQPNSDGTFKVSEEIRTLWANLATREQVFAKFSSCQYDPVTCYNISARCGRFGLRV